jgi:transposase
MTQTNEQYEMLSVSDVAKKLGVTSQTVYNQIKAGMWETQEFKRGQYKGILVKYPIK